MLGNVIESKVDEMAIEESSKIGETYENEESFVELNIFRAPTNEIAMPVDHRDLNDVSFADGVLIWTSAGSSSCPPLIEKAVLNKSDNTVILTKISYKEQMCTMDMAPVQQMIAMPDDSDLDENVEIIFSDEIPSSLEDS